MPSFSFSCRSPQAWPEALDYERPQSVSLGSSSDDAPTQKALGSLASETQTKGSLLQDRVVRGMAALCALAAVLLVAPILSDERRAMFAYLIEAPFLVAVIFALHFRVREATEETDRRFWNFLTWGFACWLGSLVIQMVYGGPDYAPELFTNVPYLLFYGGIAAALEVQPHVGPEPVTRRLRTLDRIGSLLVLFGVLLYFVVLPGLVRAEALWASQMQCWIQQEY